MNWLGSDLPHCFQRRDAAPTFKARIATDNREMRLSTWLASGLACEYRFEGLEWPWSDFTMQHTNPTILVVDDDENDRVFIKSAFSVIGVKTVHTVNSGDEAIAYLSGEGKFSDRSAHPYPHFVITDLKMPNGDGFSVLQHFKSNPQWAAMPTVVLTGSNDNDDLKRAYWLGASGYHVKPSSPVTLRVLVKALYEYWRMCEVPELDRSGKQLEADSHKLGQRLVQFPETNV